MTLTLAYILTQYRKLQFKDHVKCFVSGCDALHGIYWYSQKFLIGRSTS